MDFAKDYLSKYGWQEGQGIGKNANGIVKPIRANLKFDQAGLSFDKAAEFTNPWWEKVFDSAAENLKVNESSITVKKSKEMNSAHSIPVITYENYFRKENSKIEHDRKQEEDDNSINFLRPINDEDLLKACGGRTAHKGARHGLTLSGKLRRLVAQEEQLLNENIISNENAQNIFQTWIEVKKKKNKRKSSISSKMNDEECTNAIDSTNLKDSNHLTGVIIQEDYQLVGRSKKKKKQQRARDEDLARSLSQLSTNNTGSAPFKFCGVQDNSKAIKKERPYRKAQKGHKNRKSTNHDAKKDGRFLTSDDSERDIVKDPLVLQIKKVMNQYPSKKFKVEAEQLTPFQKKQLQKSGLRIELKSQKRKGKRSKERTQLKKIIKKMKHSMDFGSSEI